MDVALDGRGRVDEFRRRLVRQVAASALDAHHGAGHSTRQGEMLAQGFAVLTSLET